MTVANLLYYRARESRPMRMDYNLFLRAATDGLITTEQSIEEEKEEEYSRSQLEQFAKFLGSQWLIRDYRFSNDCLRIFLPPAGPGLINSVLSIGQNRSQVLIYSDGTCKANLISTDARSIRLLTHTEVDPDLLAGKVQSALMHSLRNFTAGNLEAATEAVCQVSDSRVFKKPPMETKSLKWLFAISIGGGVIAIVMFAISYLISK